MRNSDTQYESAKVNVTCPECKHDFEQDIEITIYKPDVDVELK